MHIQTHVMSGWCICNLFALTPRERLFCMVAAAAQDLDGLGILFSEELYWDYHHKLGHCLLTGVVLSLGLALFSTHRVKVLLLSLALFHLHLVLDYFGSGPGWGLYYLWPFSHAAWINQRAWAFYSWQNISTAFAFLGWVLWIAIRRGRTPLEVLMPRLDAQLVAILRRRGRLYRRRRRRYACSRR